MEERVKTALKQLDDLHAGLSEEERQRVVAEQFALVSDEHLCDLIEYCQALLAQRESRPRD